LQAPCLREVGYFAEKPLALARRPRSDCFSEKALEKGIAHRVERCAAKLRALLFSANVFFFYDNFSTRPRFAARSALDFFSLLK